MSKTHKQKLMNFDIEQYVKIVDSHKESHTLSIAEEITRLIDLGLNVKPKLDEIESKIDVISKLLDSLDSLNIEKMQWFFKYVIAYIKYICIFVENIKTNDMKTRNEITTELDRIELLLKQFNVDSDNNGNFEKSESHEALTIREDELMIELQNFPL